MVRIIRQDPDQLRNVPSDRFDAAVLNQTLYKQHYPLDLLKQVYKSLKSGGTLTVSTILSSGGMAQAHAHLRRELKSQNCYENLKRQFQHVTEFEKEIERKNHSGYMTREDLRALVLEAGFSIQSEETELFDGHTLMLVCRKISY
jgi:SAM-dependent methyltransferase